MRNIFKHDTLYIIRCYEFVVRSNGYFSVVFFVIDKLAIEQNFYLVLYNSQCMAAPFPTATFYAENMSYKRVTPKLNWNFCSQVLKTCFRVQLSYEWVSHSRANLRSTWWTHTFSCQKVCQKNDEMNFLKFLPFITQLFLFHFFSWTEVVSHHSLLFLM